jgi:hypothetical protein
MISHCVIILGDKTSELYFWHQNYNVYGSKRDENNGF